SRINANQWAVGMRGFASRLSRSVLVLVDGRSVYTPLFAGTYWEVQDVLLEDVERIEVIRGPGGTLWGANAVNGVINIITKSAKDTHGTFVDGGAGQEERGYAGARWGGSLGPHTDARVYAKYFDRDAAFHSDGFDFDRWHMAQGGFRIDGDRGPSTFTLQGDLYDGRAGERVTLTAYEPPYSRVVASNGDLGGGNLRGHWQRSLGGGAELSGQAYYDHTSRIEANFDERRDTGDVDLQYRRPAGRHEFLTGLGTRLSRGATGGAATVLFSPATRTDVIFSAFLQDRVTLTPDRLTLTVGTKVERNNYSGFELQPTARLLWMPRTHQTFWAAVSRAVRTPSRVDRDLELTASIDPSAPRFSRFEGDADFQSERAIVYEAGYRTQHGERFLLDLALFHNDYADLQSLEPGDPFTENGPGGPRQIFPVLFGNGIRGRVDGAELGVDLQISNPWRLHGSYSFLDSDLHDAPGSHDAGTAASLEGSAPHHRVVVRSSLTLGSVQLDAAGRYVSALPAQRVPGYFSLNARAAWRPWAPLEVALVGRDLLQPHHAEFGGGVEVERSIFGELSWRF
ncbi:MAG TPA: TonB-dependent receptor plug domain-containing protein, partial [Vicinamibacteria bacterium]|nr:TonB-dependent receptor plug domain-containing protein [Vicinamibacteria bacterium]